MTENNKNTLSINKKTLGLNKATVEKLTISPVAPKATSASSAKGKIVVVTKSSTRAGKAALKQMPTIDEKGGQKLSEQELDKRLQLLKDAEKSRKTELQVRIAEKDQRQQSTGIQQEDGAKSQKSKMQDQQSESEVARERQPIKKVQLNELLQHSKVRNLDTRSKSAREVGEAGSEADSVHTTEHGKPPYADKHQQPKQSKKGKVGQNEEEQMNLRTKNSEDSKFARKITIAQVMMMDSEEGTLNRRRSLASIRRAREKAKRKFLGEQQHNKIAEKIIREVNIPDVISVQELSNRMAEKTADVIKVLMKLGLIVTLNQSIDADTAELVVTEFGHKVKRVTELEIETALLQKVEDKIVDLKPRPPVVTVMGHVDHGKTSLLDALRQTDVVAGEAGGITQHIGAYIVRLKDGKLITFLDTPGHEAFTAMRMRGAKVTDIVILVVAADDGMMQQTIEAMSHARAANVPIIVAINKIDKPDANPERVKNELLSHGLVPESLGGDIMVVEVSAKNKINLDKLEEAILLQAEMLELKATVDRSAEGAVIEAQVDKRRGIVATLLVQKGTLRVGDIVIAGSAWGKIRALVNDKGQNTSEATPSMPIEVLGLESAPIAGDEFTVVQNEKTARDLVTLRLEREKQKKLVATKSVNLEQLFINVKENGIKELPVVVKADVQGSVEAITNSLTKLNNEEINVKILHSAVGGITESDVILAGASKAIIIGFNVRPNQQARDLARQNGVDIRYYSIIYNLVDDVKAAMSGMLSPLLKENVIGYVDIRQVFNLSKFGKIAGCYVAEGVVKRTANVRIIRDSVVIFDGKLKALKRFKDDVKEVNSGFECGLSFENFDDIKAGDKIEVYEVTQEARTM